MFIETSPSKLPEKLKNGKYLQRNGACETNEDYAIGQMGVLYCGQLPWFRQTLWQVDVLL